MSIKNHLEKLLNEVFHSIHYSAEPEVKSVFEIYHNPDKSEIDLIRKSSKFGAINIIIVENGNIYAWNGNVPYDQVIAKTNKKLPKTEWSLYVDNDDRDEITHFLDRNTEGNNLSAEIIEKTLKEFKKILPDIKTFKGYYKVEHAPYFKELINKYYIFSPYKEYKEQPHQHGQLELTDKKDQGVGEIEKFKLMK